MPFPELSLSDLKRPPPERRVPRCPRCHGAMVLEDRYQSGLTVLCLSCGERRLYVKREAVAQQRRFQAVARADAMNWQPKRGRPRRVLPEEEL